MKIISLSLVFLYTLCGYSQTHFPDSWVGNYKGNLEIYAVDSIAMQLPMQLSIQPTEKDSIFNWTIIYNIRGEKDIRAYELKIVDAKKGHYQIDEKNSIVIDAYFKKGIFTSFFKVMDNFIIASYTKQTDNQILFEIIAAQTEDGNVTGNQQIKKEKIPEVTSYILNGRQKAVLFKVNE